MPLASETSMPKASRIVAALLASALVAGPALAQDANPAIAARQAHMGLYMFNLGLLGGMARGNVEYDAEAASAAAANLAALSKLDQSRYWPEGTSSLDSSDSRALPELWDNIPDAIAKGQALAAAADAFAAQAGGGLEALQAGLGPVGQACSACHEAYRQPDS
jgi:cytochrome c556